MRQILLSLVILLSSFVATPAAAQDRKLVDFTRDVRPILAGKCFNCHGPDEKVRKGGLRLDVRDEAVKGQIIVPGKPDKSEVFVRISSEVPTEMMPPAKAGKPLTSQEIDVLKRWIEQGAEYAKHWAFVKPVRPPLPKVSDRDWPANPIDYFLLARLEKEGLKPMGQADRYSLARRVSLDLTGLPPTLEEADVFIRDTSVDAYERYVDRLLASPRFGERWAQVWLDLARYADSQGFANDPDRTIWRWRDWVIQALNANTPYDRFTIEQLAGDQLPGATTEQMIATGFHRNTLTNTEGGTTPEEFRSAAVVDRVNTTFQVWMGLTMGCAQCHNHKYDPFSQKEYYQLYAVFNNCEDANGGDDAPFLRVSAVGWEKRHQELSTKAAEAKKQLDELTKQVDARQAEWEKTVKPESLPKDLAPVLAQPADKRPANLKQKLSAHHRSLDDGWRKVDAAVKELDAEVKTIGTTAPILREGKPRQTNIHIRGNFLDKGEAVTAGLPSTFPAPPSGESINRLTLARWLVSEDNPLTARVAINRLWEEVFGVGLVETSEDFGLQGQLPSHPELLDWLAVEYMRSGWDTKAMLRLLVTSAAYRQSSRTTDEADQRDPFNRLLSRGPRVRTSAEGIRDQALFAGGLLSPRMYGPPVQPPRPSFGLSAAFGSTTDWQTSTGEDRHRRGLYTRIRRNAPYPSMTTFDAPERTYCNVRRLRTNTPLQALVTLNDPVYVEAAQALARRMMREGGTADARVQYGFRLCLTRLPTTAEQKRLVDLYQQALERFQKEPAKAMAFATKPIGAVPVGMNTNELAACTVIANVLLNMDETLAKR